MTFSESSTQIHRPLHEVYQIAEQYPTFVSFFTKKKVVYSDTLSVVIEVGMKKLGFLFEWAGEGHKHPNKSIEFVQTKGILKGLKANWNFESVGPKATRVAIKTCFTLSVPVVGFLLEKLAKGILVEPTTKKILIELEKASQGTHFE